MHASSDYRREMTGVLAQRLLREALVEAGTPLNGQGDGRR
jgi:CO/xanthine dehydrogenase FAD-binding subunit